MSSRTFKFSLLALFILVLSGGFLFTSTAIAQDEEEDELGVAILFSDSDLFEEYLELTEETTGLEEDEWTAEFEMHPLFITATSSNGISGQISNDIGFLDEMFAGTHDFVVYGVFQMAEDFPLNDTDEEAERGIVVYLTDEFLIVVVIDLSSDGEITAFAIFPRQENSTPLAPAFNLESPTGLFFVMAGIAQHNIVEEPTPPTDLPGQTLPGPTCAAGLEKTKDLNLTINGRETIAFGNDGTTDLYEVFLSSNRFIKVKSLQDDDLVQVSFLAPGVSRLVTLAGAERDEEFELSDSISFSLLAAAKDVRTCVIGDVEDVNGTLTITGELYEN